MQLNVQKVLRYSRLRGSKLAAGNAGLGSPVTGVTVMEISDLDEIGKSVLSVSAGDLVLTAFNDIKNDVFKQALLINRLKTCHAAGLVLFYVGKVVKKVDPQIIELCDNLCIPLILPPVDVNHHINYSGVIADVMSLIMEDIAQPSIGNTSMVHALIELAKSGDTFETAINYICKKQPCACVIFNSRKLPVAECGKNTGRMKEEFQALSKIAGYEQILRLPESSSQFKRVRLLQEVYWIGVSSANDAPEDIQLASVFPLLELAMKLWSEDLSQNSERELIKAISKNDLEQANKLSRLQRIKLNRVLAFYIASSREDASVIAELQKNVSGSYDTYGIYEIHANLKNAYIAILFAQEESPGASEFPFQEMIEGTAFSFPVFVCPVADLEDMMQVFPAAVNLYADLSVIFADKRVLTRSEVIHLIQFNSLSNLRNDSFLSYCSQALQRLEDHDKKNHLDLTDTLADLLLYEDMNYRAVAQKRYIHYNTIKYRIRKVEELLHLSVSKPADLGVLYAISLFKIYKDRLR